MLSIPSGGPHGLLCGTRIDARRRSQRGIGENEFREELREELNEIAATAQAREGRLAARKRSEAIALDCYLYARLDKHADARAAKKSPA